jgi:hypothetical protein
MINDEERVIKYLDGQLSEEEKKQFEKELETSDSLQKSLKAYKATLNHIKDLKSVKLNEEYIINAVPKFRERLENQKRFNLYPKIGWAFTAIVVLFLGYFLFYPGDVIPEENGLGLSKLTAELTEEEKESLFEYLYYENEFINYSDFETITLESLANELNNEQFARIYNFEFEDLSDGFTDEEINEIYNEMINKNFLNEVNL